MSRTHRAFLIVDCHGGMRVVKTRPSANPREYAFSLTVTIPDAVALAGSIVLDVPEPPPAEAVVEFVQ